MIDNEITREKTFSEELPHFKKRIKEVFDNYNNPNGNEDPLYICVLRDSKRIVQKAEKLGISEMTMFYDYQGIEKWAVDQWKTNKDSTKSYAEFMQPKNRSVSISFVHTKCHSGIEGNEIADIMAKNSVGIALTPNQQKLYDSVFENHSGVGTELEQIRNKGVIDMSDNRMKSCSHCVENITEEERGW